MKRYPLAIIGAGPAGMAAARTAADNGLQCVVIDEQAAAGGQIYRAIERVDDKKADILGADYLAGQALAQGLQHPLITLEFSASVWRVDDDDGSITYSRKGKAHQIKADNIFLATGAQERPYAFRGWTLPGVMTAGAAQIMLKSQGLVPEQAVLAGNGPLLYLIAVQLVRAGFPPKAILETQTKGAWQQSLRHLPAALSGGKAYLWKGLKLLAELKRAGIPHYRGIRKLTAKGAGQLEQVQFKHHRQIVTLDCPTLLVHQGVIPNIQMSRALDLPHSWNLQQQAWGPDADEWGYAGGKVYIAGDGAGIGGAKTAAWAGELSALQMCYQSDVLTQAQRDSRAEPLKRKLKADLQVRPFLDTLYQPDYRDVLEDDEVMVCRCEEVRAGQLRDKVKLGCLGLNQTKTFSRCGMGPCQGRQCGLTAAMVLADERGVDIAEIDYYRIRAPIKPVTLGEMADLVT